MKRCTQYYIKCVHTDGTETFTRGVSHLSTAITAFSQWLMDRCGKLKITTDSVGVYEAAFIEYEFGYIETVETPVFVIKRNYDESFKPMYFIKSELHTILEKEL